MTDSHSLSVGTRVTCGVCGSQAIVTTASAQARATCCDQPLTAPGTPAAQ